MKKKLTITNLALGNLKQRKKQYTTLIIGIVLAMFFSSCVLFFISCLISSNEEHDKRTVGDFYGYFYSPEGFIDAEKGKDDGYIEQYGYAHIVGYAYTDEEKLDKGTPIAWLDEDAKELYHVHFLEGKYPENTGEIAIEKDAIIRLGFEPALGEKITVSVLTPNGYAYLPEVQEKTYTVVGILSDKRNNIEKSEGGPGNIPPMAAAFICDKEEIPVGGKENIALYFNPTEESMKGVFEDTLDLYGYKESTFERYFLSDVYDKIEKVTGYGEDYHASDFLRNISNYSHNNSVYNSSLLTITLASVLMVASCIGIINAFTTNLQERKKQIGLLRAVGATRRQIINIFGREAFIITLIAAPICVFASYFGVKLFATIMGDAFIFIPNVYVLLGSTAISVTSVMLAAIIPLLKASRVTPMQAIRNVELSRKMTRKKIRQHKKFRVPTLLANRSMKFYKSKQIGVSIILTITIILTCFGCSLLKYNYGNNDWKSYYRTDYCIERGTVPESSEYVNMPEIKKGLTHNDIQAIYDYPLFKSVYGSKECISYIICDEFNEYMNILQFTIDGTRYQESGNKHSIGNTIDSMNQDEIFDAWFDGEFIYYTQAKEKSKTDKEMFKFNLMAYDPQMIENNINNFEIIDGKIDIDKINSGEEVVLIGYEELGLAYKFDEYGRHVSTIFYDMKNENPEKHEKENGKVYLTAELGYKAGDKINLRTLYSDMTESEYIGYEESAVPDNIECVDKEVEIGAIVRPYNFNEAMLCRFRFGIFTSVDGMAAITNHNHGYEVLCVDIKGENDDATDAAAMEYLNGVFSGGYFKPFSVYNLTKDDRDVMKSFLVAMFSVVILFFSICASMVNNALTAKIRESKKEIGTLRAVGASVKDITESYIRQLLLMFVWGGGFGFGGYIAINSAIWIISKKDFPLPFEIWQAAVLFVLLLDICSLNLYLNVKKQMKHSIVENIREL